MSIFAHFREVLILAPIVGLLFVGLIIALQSGLAGADADGVRQRLAVNLSHLVLRLAGYGVVLLTMQRCVGIRMNLGW